MTKKTKIVATIGPATSSVENLSKLLKIGFNVMRMNFSHGDFAEHQEKVDNLKVAVKKTGIPAATLQDLGGPKIRIGTFKNGVINLKNGQTFTLTTDEVVGDETRVSVNYKPMAKELKVGNIVMLHDGKKKLQITAIKGNNIITKVLVGGEIKDKRGINLPGAYLSISSLTPKDKKDIEFGLKNKVDFVAFSFVRRPADIIELRDILNKAKSEAKIIAKIEDVEGLENIDKIIELVDGIMVARGDLAIEIGMENVPMNQKSIIKKCNEKGKIVITATHMLESMIKAPVPTRAEVSDIANAILDGTDAIMLSEETTLGDFPMEAVQVMTTVAEKVESDPMYKELVTDVKHLKGMSHNTTDAITSEAVDTAEAIDAKLIVALTMTGFTARMISRFKPTQPIVAFTPSEKTANQLLLSFGVTSVLMEKLDSLPEAIAFVKSQCVKAKLAARGDKIVIVAGLPFGKKVIETNTLLVETL